MRSAAVVLSYLRSFLRHLSVSADLAESFDWMGVRVAESNVAPMPQPED